jgi:hypothetical protein
MTLIFAIFTDWGGGDDESGDETRAPLHVPARRSVPAGA